MPGFPVLRLPVPATFHVFLHGETIAGMAEAPQRPLTDAERGLVVGVLIGEGHFGGDGRYPQITLRMHVRHEALFRWLQRLFPRSRLYGPYGHGGRNYYQWMARGAALAEDVLPVVESLLSDEIDAHVAGRVRAMREDYADFFRRQARAGSGSGADAGSEEDGPG